MLFDDGGFRYVCMFDDGGFKCVCGNCKMVICQKNEITSNKYWISCRRGRRYS